MSEPDIIKFHFEYHERDNVRSKVPGEQKIRESVEASELAIAKSTVSNSNKVDNGAYTLTPVITVTKNEEIRNGVFHTIKPPSYPEIHSDVLHEPQPIRVGMGDQSSDGDDKKRTRIPKLRFRQAANRVKRERRESNETENGTTSYQRRSSIPRLKTRLPTQERKQADEEPTPLDDEFDKIYDEVVTSPVELNVSILNANVDDPVDVEHIFDEIIHAYDDDSIQPIAVDKKQSRIPTFKRKSENDIELPKNFQKTASDNNPSANRVKVKDVINKYSNEESTPKYRKPTRAGVPKTKPFKSTYDDNNDSLSQEEAIKSSLENPSMELRHDVSFVNSYAAPNEDEGTPTNSLGIIDLTQIEDSDFINKVSYSTIEVCEDKVPIHHETVELLTANECEVEHRTAQKPVEEVRLRELASVEETNLVTPSLLKESEYLVHYNVVEESNIIDDKLNKHNNLETNTVEVKEEMVPEHIILESTKINELPPEDEIPLIKGKVSRIIHRLGSREPKEDIKIVVEKEIPKTKSVLSRIAMFERHEPLAAPKPRENKIPRFKPNSTYKEVKPFENPKDTKPSIVSEIFKTTHNEIDSNKDNNTAYNRVPVEYNNNVASREIKTMSIEIVDIPTKSEEMVISQDQITEDMFKDINNEFAPYVINERDDNVLVDTEEIVLQPVDAYKIEYAQPIKSIDSEPISFEPKYNQIRILNSNEDVVYINYDKEKQRVETKNIDNYDSIKSYKIEPKVEAVKVYKRREEIEVPTIEVRLRRLTSTSEEANLKKTKSTAELDLGNAVRGKVRSMIVRMNSSEKLNVEKREVINVKERPRKKSVSEKIALFEGRLSIATSTSATRVTRTAEPAPPMNQMPDDDLQAKVAELESAKLKYGTTQDLKRYTLADGVEMPKLAVGTALLDPKLTAHVISAAIDLGYRAIDTAYIYGNEKQVGEAIKKKIEDGTVKREDLFIISKLWSTFHRTDLVEQACRNSLDAMGLDYFDLYLIHNPMSFKEGPDPLPKIANVLQYSEHDYLDAWYGMEDLVARRLARSVGVSNFNAPQLQRLVEKARVKPTVNQVECHPFLSQQKLDDFCQERGIKLACFGVLGSKGTPAEYKGFNNLIIDDPLVQVMAAGLSITPAQLLIRYQLDQNRAVVVKASSAKRLHENLQALHCSLNDAQLDALTALNRNKRTFTFKGMGDTHKNYPFRAPF